MASLVLSHFAYLPKSIWVVMFVLPFSRWSTNLLVRMRNGKVLVLQPGVLVKVNVIEEGSAPGTSPVPGLAWILRVTVVLLTRRTTWARLYNSAWPCTVAKSFVVGMSIKACALVLLMDSVTVGTLVL